MEKGNILIVDDVSTHLLLLQNILEQEGYTILTYSDPNMALDAVYLNSIDVILLDLMMPDLDGFEFLDRIKQDKKISDIHVIVISAKTDSWSMKNAMDKGAFDYLTKPINIHDLKNKVRAAITKKENTK
ncbi:MAG: response regulator [Bacteroidetes bacterium]|nr:response regulator [Bacteroidota bacterium]